MAILQCAAKTTGRTPKLRVQAHRDLVHMARRSMFEGPSLQKAKERSNEERIFGKRESVINRKSALKRMFGRHSTIEDEEEGEEECAVVPVAAPQDPAPGPQPVDANSRDDPVPAARSTARSSRPFQRLTRHKSTGVQQVRKSTPPETLDLKAPAVGGRSLSRARSQPSSVFLAKDAGMTGQESPSTCSNEGCASQTNAEVSDGFAASD